MPFSSKFSTKADRNPRRTIASGQQGQSLPPPRYGISSIDNTNGMASMPIQRGLTREQMAAARPMGRRDGMAPNPNGQVRAPQRQALPQVGIVPPTANSPSQEYGPLPSHASSASSQYDQPLDAATTASDIYRPIPAPPEPEHEDDHDGGPYGDIPQWPTPQTMIVHEDGPQSPARRRGDGCCTVL